ncbi:MAG: hypothetical protein HQK51_20560, partial [Oligoflexia bacterium]|nr:hypothetical protein [Oligoflexia bacterium]
MNIKIPSFVIEISPENNLHRKWGHINRYAVSISEKDYRPVPFFYEENEIKVCILGNPVVKETINYQLVAKELVHNYNNNSWLQTIDSEFLFIILNQNISTLTIITSRFCSPPFYYFYQKDIFIGSFSFFDITQRLKQLNMFMLRDDSLFELISYKRIFGHKTHEKSTVLASSSSVIVFDGKQVSTHRYWKPSFKKNYSNNLEENAHNLSFLIQNSIKKKTSDNPRPSLFLSGGMDARTILAAFNFNKLKCGLPTCFTIAKFENREVQVAKQLANSIGAQHVYIPFCESDYPKVFTTATKITSSMHLPFFMFLGHEKVVSKYADVIFHGHGLDYFFQGKYLPSQSPSILGHKLNYAKITSLEKERHTLDDYFLKNIPYRILFKDPSTTSLFINSKFNDYYEKTKEDVRITLAEAQELSDSLYDQYEYLTFYNFTRHYSFPDHWTMNTNLPQRTISFDNDIYQFY